MKMTTNEKLLYLKSLTIYFIAAPFAAHRSTFTRRVGRRLMCGNDFGAHAPNLLYVSQTM